MLLEISIILFLATSIYFCYLYNRIRIPDGVDNQKLYKVTCFMLSIFGTVSKVLSLINRKEEIVNFKTIGKILFGLKPKESLNDNVKISETTISGVNVRTYEPSKRPNRRLPLLIFYHGGAFVAGDADMHDPFLVKVVNDQQMAAISINYRLAPEHPFPTPTDDCYAVTKYVFENSGEFSIDPDRVVLAGDSAGGNIVAVITQRLLKDSKYQAKLQVFIYPWLQMANLDLPSYQMYKNIGIIYEMGLGFGHYTRWYLNVNANSYDIVDAIESYEHIKLLDKKQLKDNFVKLLDTRLIPSEYIDDTEAEYYKNYSARIHQAINSQPSERGNILKEKSTKDSLLKVLDVEVSPAFADDETLAKLPPAHFAISRTDTLKDEALIYAERLKRTGVKVNVKYYKNAFHGTFSALRPPQDYQVAHVMVQDIQDFISANI